ncbi:unnamed protein product [Anisakis simplex]|uniref:Uncharacterized protein n=1 Tax=Anisakis simplex TaxID=6269 RepID=A0A3P6SBR1_ANISI|nr:unnamed protein product [Anisakis simplex]
MTTTTIDAVSTTVSVPPVPPSPLNYESPSTSDQKKEDANVLDAILDELTSEQNSPSQRKRETKSMSPSIHGPTPPYYPQASLHQQRNEPPKPPERQIKGDIRTRYTPSQLQQLQRHAATIYANSTANSTNTNDSASHTNSFGDRNPASGANTNTTTLPPQHNNSGFNSAGYYNQSHASATNGTAIGATGRATPTSHSAATLPNNSTNGSKPAERSMQKPPTPISSIDALGVSDPSTHGTSSNESINSQEGTRLMSADAIEERQHELAARQQQLYSQFEQLRQMCPSSPTNV